MIRRAFARAACLSLGLALLLAPSRADVTFLFSPPDDIERAWVTHIAAARHRIHVACFGLSNRAIAASLSAAARDRHVEVIILEDQRQAGLAADLHRQVAAAGGHIIIKRSGALLHDKMATFDARAAILGSWNLSQGAARQDNATVVIDRELKSVARIEAAWRRMFKREMGQDYRPGMMLPPVSPAPGGSR